jgi:hypothetical protein
VAQRTWLYKTPKGTVFEIGLYHGDKSGHLLLYVGNEIVKIEFSVKDTQEYNFMIDDELFKVLVIQGKEFDYKLYNESQDQEIPLIGKVGRNKQYVLMMSLVIAVLILVALGILFFAIKM